MVMFGTFAPSSCARLGRLHAPATARAHQHVSRLVSVRVHDINSFIVKC